MIFIDICMTFKDWIESTADFSGISTQISGHPETEHDPFIPDQIVIQHALQASKRIKGFFPAFRHVVKIGIILKAFWDALQRKIGGEIPFNYQKSDWLNDDIQQFIASETGLDVNQVEPYCEPLKHYFVQMFNNTKSWDYEQQSQSWPGYKP